MRPCLSKPVLLKERERAWTMVLTSKNSIQNVIKKKKQNKNTPEQTTKSIQTEGTNYRGLSSVGGERQVLEDARFH